MTKFPHVTRRNFLQSAGSLATVAGLSRFSQMNALAAGAPDYRALVCVFLFGGNDSHNMLVPQTPSIYSAYQGIRGSLALPDTNASFALSNSVRGHQ